MAREYAPVKVAIWSDDDFRKLTIYAQHLYFLLMTSPTLSHAGVADWRPNRIAALARGWSEEDVIEAARELEDRLYVVVDQSTEEILIRSFVRHDGLMKQPKMAVSMANAHAGISSAALRGVIVHELLRLKEDRPDLSGWSLEKASELLTKTAIDPATFPTRPDGGPPKPTPKGTPKSSEIKGLAMGKPPAPTPAPTTTTSNLHPGATAASAVEMAALAEAVRDEWISVRRSRNQEPSRKQKIEIGTNALEALESHPFEMVMEAARRSARGGFVRLDIEISKMTSQAAPPRSRGSSSNSAAQQALSLLRPDGDHPPFHEPRAIGATR